MHPQHARVDRQVGAEPARREDVRAQLLAALADDRGGLGLTRLHPAAGQLPPAGHCGRPGALGGEHPAVADDGGGDDDRMRGERRRPAPPAPARAASRPRMRRGAGAGRRPNPHGAAQRTSSCTSVSGPSAARLTTCSSAPKRAADQRRRDPARRHRRHRSVRSGTRSPRPRSRVGCGPRRRGRAAGGRPSADGPRGPAPPRPCRRRGGRPRPCAGRRRGGGGSRRRARRDDGRPAAADRSPSRSPSVATRLHDSTVVAMHDSPCECRLAVRGRVGGGGPADLQAGAAGGGGARRRRAAPALHQRRDQGQAEARRRRPPRAAGG